ncbi:MAG: Asp-tRNA(Asn)/Glu-tRNA(Gln) amidotransferase subunit GatC [Candidatus Omnitrophica bacterium]|nr:Asp-tRNA(Asn)/Glu-tRNA(Gln) amidotransferase subunit GatC [Candidatus Omnitrophota bacterium]
MVDKKTVEYVAGLARIEVSEEQKQFLESQLSNILSYIDKLKKLDVEGVEPLRGLHLERNVLRNDEVKPSTAKEEILENAPSRQERYFKIPKVLE